MMGTGGRGLGTGDITEPPVLAGSALPGERYVVGDLYQIGAPHARNAGETSGGTNRAGGMSTVQGPRSEIQCPGSNDEISPEAGGKQRQGCRGARELGCMRGGDTASGRRAAGRAEFRVVSFTDSTTQELKDSRDSPAAGSPHHVPALTIPTAWDTPYPHQYPHLRVLPFVPRNRHRAARPLP